VNLTWPNCRRRRIAQIDRLNGVLRIGRCVAPFILLIVRFAQPVRQAQNVEPLNPQLSSAIRQIRQRLGMNTTKFGSLIGVAHSQISRYEAGRALPGFLALGRLLQLA